jgi:hypothetical protein
MSFVPVMLPTEQSPTPQPNLHPVFTFIFSRRRQFQLVFILLVLAHRAHHGLDFVVLHLARLGSKLCYANQFVQLFSDAIIR